MSVAWPGKTGKGLAAAIAAFWLASLTSVASAASSHDDGRRDRLRWELWLGTLTCNAREGADYWLAHRDNSQPGSRSSPCERADPSKPLVIIVCRTAQKLLSPMDARKATDGDYRAGWDETVELTRQANCPAYKAPEHAALAAQAPPIAPPRPNPAPVPAISAPVAAPAAPVAQTPPTAVEPSETQVWQTLMKLMLGQMPGEPARETVPIIWLAGAVVLAFLGLAGRWIPTGWWETDEQAGWRGLNSKLRDATARLAPLSPPLLWGSAVLVVLGFVYAVWRAQFDLLNLDWTFVALLGLAVGVWRAMRDGRGPLWRMAILLTSALLLASWFGLVAAIVASVENAISSIFAKGDQWMLGFLLVIGILAVRGSAWVYATLITEWRLNPVTGERHRVLSRSHGEVLLDHRTWLQRRNEEMLERRERRKHLLPQLVILGACGFAILYGWAKFSDLPFVYAAGLLAGGLSVASFLSGMVFKPLLPELLYQTGYQGMKGAKVFDRKPKPKTPPFGAPPPQPAEDDEHGGRRTA